MPLFFPSRPTLRAAASATRVISTTRQSPPDKLNQSSADFAGVHLQGGDYLARRITQGVGTLYGASVDDVANDPSVEVLTK